MKTQEDRRRYLREWRARNPGKAREKFKKWYLANRPEQLEKMKGRDRAIREIVLRAYGPVCICCGERNQCFLALDHVDDDGAEHRRLGKKSGYTFYKKLQREGYPSYIQILCHNCNVSKGLYGYCPHGNCWRSMLTTA